MPKGKNPPKTIELSGGVVVADGAGAEMGGICVSERKKRSTTTTAAAVAVVAGDVAVAAVADAGAAEVGSAVVGIVSIVVGDAAAAASLGQTWVQLSLSTMMMMKARMKEEWQEGR